MKPLGFMENQPNSKPNGVPENKDCGLVGIQQQQVIIRRSESNCELLGVSAAWP